MGRLHEIRLRSEAFVRIMDLHIANSIKNVEPDLLKINKGQLLKSKDALGKPLTNLKTGSQYLSSAYARRKGKRTPNLYDTGQFQSEMFLEVDEKRWFIDSFDNKTKYLTENYGNNIFGISDKQRAKQLTGKSFKRLYERLVLAK